MATRNKKRKAARAEKFGGSKPCANGAMEPVQTGTEGNVKPEILIRGQGPEPKRWELRMERDAISRAIRDALPDQDITEVFRGQVVIAKDITNPRQASIAAGVISKAIDKLIGSVDENGGGTVINGDVLIQQAYKQFDAQEPEYREWKRKQQLQSLVGPVDLGCGGFESQILGPVSPGGAE
jgi:hypothetical protein